VITLGYSLLPIVNLVNIIHERWWRVSMISSPSSDTELGILQIIDQEGS